MNFKVFTQTRNVVSPKTPMRYLSKRITNCFGVFLLPEDNIDELIKKIDLIDIAVEKEKIEVLEIFILGTDFSDYKPMFVKLYPHLNFNYLGAV